MGVIQRLDSSKVAELATPDPTDRVRRTRVVPVQRSIADVLPLRDSDIGHLAGTLCDSIAHNAVGGWELPCEEDIEREQSPRTRSRVGGGGGVGIVGEDGRRQKWFHGVGNVDASFQYELSAPELPSMT